MDDEVDESARVLSGMTAQQQEQIARYVRDEPADVGALRAVAQPAFPWPSTGNPMLAYLLERAQVSAKEDGASAALVWVAVHAWFEGALAALSTRSSEGPNLDRDAVVSLMLRLGVGEQQARTLAEGYAAAATEERRRAILGEPSP